MNCAAPIADNLALVNGTQSLTAVNVATHATAWSIAGAFKGTPAMANQLVYVISGLEGAGIQRIQWCLRHHAAKPMMTPV